MSRRHRAAVRLLVPLGAVVAVVGWAGACGWLAREELLAARAGTAALSGSDLSGVQAQEQLAAAAARASEARALMRQPGPRLVELVPVLGRSLRAERATAEAGAAVLAEAGRLLPRLEEVAPSSGAVDVAALQDLQADLAAAARRTEAPVRDLRAADLGLVPGAVESAVRDAQAALGDVPAALRKASDGAGALAGLLGAEKPRTLVVAVMNNAELRGAGGYSSSVAVVRTDRGRVEVGPFQDVNEFEDDAATARRVPAPDDYRLRYGVFLADTTLWKNVLMSPDVTASASVLCEAAKVTPGVPCDGVLLLDVPAVARLTEVAGPTRLPDGSQLAGDELVRALLVDAYADAEGAQGGRRAALRASADAAVAGLLAQDLGSVATLRVLADAAAGRHLAVWSAEPAEQEALVRAGLAGDVDPAGRDVVLFAVNQFSAGKLDYWVRREQELDVEVGGDRAAVTQSVRLSLDMPDDLPPYVRGTRGDRLTGLGELAVSPGATVRSVLRDGEPVPHEVVRDTGSQRVVVELDVANRSAVTWTVAYEVPLRDGAYAVRLLPQPLAAPGTLRLSVRAVDGLALEGGDVERAGPFERAETLEIRRDEPSWWERRVELG